MSFGILLRVVFLLGLTWVPLAKSAIAQNESGETDPAINASGVPAEFESDGDQGSDGEDHNHAIFVWSIVLGCVAGGFGIVGLVLWLIMRYEKKRATELAIIANELGFQFSPHKDERLLSMLQQFRLFNSGHSRRMKNVMTAATEHTILTIFDYQFTTGGGKHSQTHSHTLVAAESSAFQFPRFSIWPEGLGDKIGAKFGRQDIDFDQHPDFSSKFVLQADDENAVRRFLTSQILDWCVSRPDLSVDSVPGLLTYRKAGRRKPEEIRDFMSEAYDFSRVLEENSRGQDREQA